MLKGIVGARVVQMIARRCVDISASVLAHCRKQADALRIDEAGTRALKAHFIRQRTNDGNIVLFLQRQQAVVFHQNRALQYRLLGQCLLLLCRQAFCGMLCL